VCARGRPRRIAPLDAVRDGIEIEPDLEAKLDQQLVIANAQLARLARVLKNQRA